MPSKVSKSCGFCQKLTELENCGTLGQIACEILSNFKWNSLDGIVGNVKVCWMKEKTSISSSKFTISSELEKDVEALSFRENKRINFLPIKVHEKFPSLLVYGSSQCSIKEISKANFEKLSKLKILWLDGNEIEIIATDVFEDLSSLIKLRLSIIFL